MRDVVIVSAARTPIGDFMGSLKDVSAIDLGVTALKGAIGQAGIEAGLIQEVVAGHLYQASGPGNTAAMWPCGPAAPLKQWP